jgi:hypothetical protein
MDTGVKVVGATAADDEPRPDNAAPTSGAAPKRPWRSGGRTNLLLIALSVVGLVGTLVFGLLWATSSSSGVQDPAVLSASRAFLTDLTNFNAKSVDADFGAITRMSTGSFSSQANKFFNSSIRTALETALAESRGQIRNLYVQSESGGQAVVYAVVDQVYVNNKISTPQADVLRVLVNLQQVGSTWKIADVTVLEGATSTSAGSASGSAGSSVAGQ